MKRVLAVTCTIVVLLVGVPSALAARDRTGQRIRLDAGPSTYPAGEAFYIQHGWVLEPSESPLGVFDFTLEIDGQYVAEDFVDHIVDNSHTPPWINFQWVHNFPDGMVGAHSFSGHWFMPCATAVRRGSYPGPCETPNEKVEVLNLTLDVEFESP